MRVLVTGGAGYTGSHTVKELICDGHEPIVYDNLQTGHREAVKNSLFVHGDLADPEKIKPTLRSYSIQSGIHLAADCLVGESMREPLKSLNNNVRNGLQLLEAMACLNIKNWFFSPLLKSMEGPQKAPFPKIIPAGQRMSMGKQNGSLNSFYRIVCVDDVGLMVGRN